MPLDTSRYLFGLNSTNRVGCSRQALVKHVCGESRVLLSHLGTKHVPIVLRRSSPPPTWEARNLRRLL